MTEEVKQIKDFEENIDVHRQVHAEEMRKIIDTAFLLFSLFFSPHF